MDDVVGILVEDAVKGERGLLCWGRIFDPVDSAELLAHVAGAVRVFGIDQIVSISLCDELAELSDFEYFYEGLISFAAAKSESLNDRAARLRQDERAFQKSLYMLGKRRSGSVRPAP